MLIQLTIHAADDARLVDLCRALRECGMEVAGRITQRGADTVEFSIVTSGGRAVDSLCGLLIDKGLAQTVVVQRLDPD